MATSKGVNVPTNEKVKEKDVNAKLQLYGIFEGTPSPGYSRVLRALNAHSRPIRFHDTDPLRSIRPWQSPIGKTCAAVRSRFSMTAVANSPAEQAN